MTNRRTVGILGTGYMGKQHLKVWRELGVQPVLCDSGSDAAKALAEECGAPLYGDYHTMMEEVRPDAVSVCLPTRFHYDAARTALELGIAVLCEKPFTLETAQAGELCRLSEDTGTLLMVGHPLRFAPAYVYLQRLVRDKEYGELRSLHLYRHTERPGWSAGGWLSKPAESGGVLLDLHIHDSDILYSMLGMPQMVTVLGDSCHVSVMYRYPENIAVTSAASWRNVKAYPFSSGYDAVFERASVRCMGEQVRVFTDDNVSEPTLPQAFDGAGEDALTAEIRYFYRCLTRKEAPALCMPRDTFAVMQLNDGERRSLHDSRTVCF